jgi:type II secretory ATPase GspE/PulE/Tfp pilus assembly ATPase PilB-like protein
MSTELAHSIVPTMETCPNCKGRMTITQVTPILFTDDLEDVSYKCIGCRSEMKRTFKRRSGTWQLIHYTPKLPAAQHADSSGGHRWSARVGPAP